MNTTVANIAQPDVTLFLDMEGVIRDVTLSNALANESVDAWIGRPWIDTVGELGSDKVKRMVDDARTSRVSIFRQVTQRFPSGLELLLEYTTVKLGGKSGLVAIGKNLQAVAELQSRLIAAQQAMERDYWKLREVETRYRLLFSASNEAVLLIRAANLRIVEANPAALRALGLAPQRPEGVAGRELLPEVAPAERDAFQAMLMRVREQGKAPGFLVHLGPDRGAWLVRASLMTSEPGVLFLLQLAPAGGIQPQQGRGEHVFIEELIERGPDGFIVLDQEGVILRANRAFLELVQLGAERSVVGERLARWLGRPGADVTVLLATVVRHGVVRLFSTTIHGELGTDAEVELSAVGNTDSEPEYVGVLLRDVGRRLSNANDADHLSAVLGSLTEQIGKTTLRKLVDDTVGVVERHYIEAALELTSGNRTAAAEVLGLSRQSLYAKLDRYDLDGSSQSAPDRTE
jgi:transcriptional regulator PpsR